MSGSSLDGLDMAHCVFNVTHKPYFKINSWQITHAETCEYNEEILAKLRDAVHYSGKDLCRFDHELGVVMGNMTSDFIQKHHLSPNFISSHGHTVFHYPAEGFTLQAGHPAEIAAITGFPVAGDFRSTDIALQGQGAPFAPIADKMLFSEYEVLVNMGGIMNLSFQLPGRDIVAFDVCPCNQTLNHLAAHFGEKFDKNGEIASSGNIDNNLLQQLTDWDYFRHPAPKSLDNSQIKTDFHRIIDIHPAPAQDKLATVTEMIALSMADAVKAYDVPEMSKLLFTGGGAFNTFLMKKIAEKLPRHKIILPDKLIISFKEGLLLALMGLLRVNNIPNVLRSVTGSTADHIAGAIYQGINKFIHEPDR